MPSLEWRMNKPQQHQGSQRGGGAGLNGGGTASWLFGWARFPLSLVQYSFHTSECTYTPTRPRPAALHVNIWHDKLLIVKGRRLRSCHVESNLKKKKKKHLALCCNCFLGTLVKVQKWRFLTAATQRAGIGTHESLWHFEKFAETFQALLTRFTAHAMRGTSWSLDKCLSLIFKVRASINISLVERYNSADPLC